MIAKVMVNAESHDVAVVEISKRAYKNAAGGIIKAVQNVQCSSSYVLSCRICQFIMTVLHARGRTRRTPGGHA